MVPQVHEDWDEFKVDDWMGPKTIEAFGGLLKDEDADRLTVSYGRSLL